MRAVPSPWCSQLSWSDFGSAAGVAEKTGLMQMRTIKTRQGQTPKFAERERTYLGENFFSLRCFNALWTFSLSLCRPSQMFCYWRCTCGLGVNKKVVRSLSSLRDLGTFHRTVPWSAGENRELSFPESQPILCSTLEEKEKQQGLCRLSLARVWVRPHLGTNHWCPGHPHAAKGAAHWKAGWPRSKVSRLLNLPRLWPPRTHNERSCTYLTGAGRRMWDSLQGVWTKVCTGKWVHHIL